MDSGPGSRSSKLIQNLILKCRGIVILDNDIV